MSDGDTARKIEEMFSEANWDKTCRWVTTEMHDHVAPFGTPNSISSREGGSGKHLGTGTYIDLFRVKLLLSCQHVLGKLKTEPLAHKLGGHERFVAMDHRFYGEASLPVDAAVVVVSYAAWEDLAGGSTSVPVRRFAHFHAPAARELSFHAGLRRREFAIRLRHVDDQRDRLPNAGGIPSQARRYFRSLSLCLGIPARRSLEGVW
jgi:hypothetical protein